MINNIIKNKKTIVYGLAVVAVVAAIAITIISITSGNDSSDVPEETGTDVVNVKTVKVDDSEKHAKDLFKHKVEDINDTALIVELFEVMDLEELTGEYTVEISQEGDTMILALNVLEGVKNADKRVFDTNIKNCAQQMLALIPQVDRVQWTYRVMTSGSAEETSVESFNRVDFESVLGKAPEYFGKSERNIKKLLEKQKES